MTKPSKYRNRKTEIDGRVFDSKRELTHYLDLREQQRAGLITELRCQVPIDLVVNGKKIGEYIADFVFKRDGAEVIEDVKGFRTEIFKFKKKVLEANGIRIVEV